VDGRRFTLLTALACLGVSQGSFGEGWGLTKSGDA
jgi:hypothetical protein